MAEPSPADSKKLVEIFLKKYNADKSTKFQWIEGKSYQPKDKPYFDFIVFDGSSELGMQHTVAVADPEREYVLPKLAERVVYPVLEMLLTNSKLPPLHIHANFHNPPLTNEDRRELIYWLEYIIQYKVTSSLRVGYFSMDSSFDDHYLPRIKKYIDDLEILPRPSWNNKGDKIVIGFGWSKPIPQAWLNDAQRIINAVEKKEVDCRDVLLLVEAGLSPMHDAYKQQIVDVLAQKKMNEIWLVELFLNKERALRLK